jgi:hypothetical protein
MSLIEMSWVSGIVVGFSANTWTSRSSSSSGWENLIGSISAASLPLNHSPVRG